MTKEKMVGWHHWLNGHELEQALGVGDAIHKSHPLFLPSPPALDLSQHQGFFFTMSRPLTFGDQNIGASASASVLPINI